MNTHRSLKSKLFDHAVIAAMLLTPFAAASAQNLTSAPNFVPFSEFVQSVHSAQASEIMAKRGAKVADSGASNRCGSTCSACMRA